MQKQRRGKKDLPDANDEKELQRRYNQEANAYFAQVVRDNPGASHAEVNKLVRIKYPPYEEWLDRQRRY